MNKDLDDIQFRQINDINFRKLFPILKPTDVTLNCISRRKVIKTINMIIEHNSLVIFIQKKPI